MECEACDTVREKYVHGYTCTQIRNMERDGKVEKDILWSMVRTRRRVREGTIGHVIRTRVEKYLTLQGDVRRRYKIMHGPATLVYDTETHLDGKVYFHMSILYVLIRYFNFFFLFFFFLV